MLLLKVISNSTKLMVDVVGDYVQKRVPLSSFDFTKLEEVKHLSEKDIFVLIEEAGRRKDWGDVIEIAEFVEKQKPFISKESLQLIYQKFDKITEKLKYVDFDLMF